MICCNLQRSFLFVFHMIFQSFQHPFMQTCYKLDISFMCMIAENLSHSDPTEVAKCRTLFPAETGGLINPRSFTTS